MSEQSDSNNRVSVPPDNFRHAIAGESEFPIHGSIYHEHSPLNSRPFQLKRF